MKRFILLSALAALPLCMLAQSRPIPAGTTVQAGETVDAFLMGDI